MDMSVDKVNEVFNIAKMDVESKDINVKDYDISFENVEFSYDKRKILKNVSFNIPENTTTAIVGPSGGEKQRLSITRDKTIIMIAHRLKTVRNADQILVIDDGKIVQKGNHKALIKEEGIYKRFIDVRKEAVGWRL